MRGPGTITGAFEGDARRQRDDLINQTACTENTERCSIHRLLALPLRMTKAREQCLAVEHYSRVGGEDEIGQAVLWLNQLDAGAAAAKRAAQALPLPYSGAVQHVATLLPSDRIHPGIDAVGDGK